MQDVLGIIGNVSNVVAAGCAVFAIVVTVNQYKQSIEQEKGKRIAEKRDTLFKESVIDFFIRDVTRNVSEVNKEMLNLANHSTLNSEMLNDLYRKIRADSQVWLYEVEI